MGGNFGTTKKDTLMVYKHKKAQELGTLTKEMQMQMRSTRYLLHWPQFKRLRMLDINSDVEQARHSCIVCWNVTWYNHIGRSLRISHAFHCHQSVVGSFAPSDKGQALGTSDPQPSGPWCCWWTLQAALSCWSVTACLGCWSLGSLDITLPRVYSCFF